MHLLFWLSLFPFATGWMGENHFTTAPTALYGAVLLMAAIAYYVLQQSLIRAQGQDSILKKAVGRDWKGKLSLVLYLVAIVATLGSTSLAQGIFVSVALIWLIPDPRINACCNTTPSSHRSCHKSIVGSVLASARDRRLRNALVSHEGDNYENRSDRWYWTHWIKACQ